MPLGFLTCADTDARQVVEAPRQQFSVGALSEDDSSENEERDVRGEHHRVSVGEVSEPEHPEQESQTKRTKG